MRHQGWTLKELLIVIVILIALLALLYPVYQIVRYRSLEAKCRANLWAIYTKYKLLKMENGGRWDKKVAHELHKWLHSPEGLKVYLCPLSGEPYTVPPVHRVINYEEPYLIARLEKGINLYVRDHLVAYCDCHTNPPRPRCGAPYVAGACVLSVLDIGDGKIEYGFDIYTKNSRTGEIIWPREGIRCPDPKDFPDVSKGY
jgi:type II secretory pathway pseudopilin PulG